MSRDNMKRQLESLGFTDASVLIGPGVYALGYKDEIVWVGQSIALAHRIGNHLTKNEFAFDSVHILPLDPLDLSCVESYLILKLNPRYNTFSPFSLYHKVKGGLLGRYDQAERRRLTAVMGYMGLSYDELINGTEWNEPGDSRSLPGSWEGYTKRMTNPSKQDINTITIGSTKLSVKSWRRV